MNKKLTISVDDSTIEEAKKFARSKGQSLSEIIENYLKLLLRKSEKPAISSKISKLKGAIKISGIVEYKQLREDAISEKYTK